MYPCFRKKRRKHIRVLQCEQLEIRNVLSVVVDTVDTVPCICPPPTKTITHDVVRTVADGTTYEYVGNRHRPLQNPVDRLDANNDGHVSPIDALTIINFIESGHAIALSGPNGDIPWSTFYDTNGDNAVSAADVLGILNRLNRKEVVIIQPEDVALEHTAPIHVDLGVTYDSDQVGAPTSPVLLGANVQVHGWHTGHVTSSKIFVSTTHQEGYLSGYSSHGVSVGTNSVRNLEAQAFLLLKGQGALNVQIDVSATVTEGETVVCCNYATASPHADGHASASINVWAYGHYEVLVELSGRQADGQFDHYLSGNWATIGNVQSSTFTTDVTVQAGYKAVTHNLAARDEDHIYHHPGITATDHVFSEASFDGVTHAQGRVQLSIGTERTHVAGPGGAFQDSRGVRLLLYPGGTISGGTFSYSIRHAGQFFGDDHEVVLGWPHDTLIEVVTHGHPPRLTSEIDQRIQLLDEVVAELFAN